MPTDTAIAAIIGGGSAAIIGGLFALINNFIIRRSEERKHRRELAVKIASDHWKFVYERAKDAPIDLDNLSLLIVNAMTLMTFVDGKFHNETALRKQLERGFEQTSIAETVLNEHKCQKQRGK